MTNKDCLWVECNRWQSTKCKNAVRRRNFCGRFHRARRASTSTYLDGSFVIHFDWRRACTVGIFQTLA